MSKEIPVKWFGTTIWMTLEDATIKLQELALSMTRSQMSEEEIAEQEAQIEERRTAFEAIKMEGLL